MGTQKTKNMNDSIVLPWTMEMNWFYKWSSTITSLFLFSNTTFDLLTKNPYGTTPDAAFIPITVGIVILFGVIRSVRCSEEGITITRGFIWSKSSSWKNINFAEIKNAVLYYRGVPSRYLMLTIKTNEKRTIKLKSHLFRLKDIETLAGLLRKKATRAVLRLDYDPI